MNIRSFGAMVLVMWQWDLTFGTLVFKSILHLDPSRSIRNMDEEVWMGSLHVGGQELEHLWIKFLGTRTTVSARGREMWPHHVYTGVLASRLHMSRSIKFSHE